MQRPLRLSGIILSALIVLAPAGAVSARAGIVDKSWETGGYLDLSTFDNNSTLDDAYGLGARVAYYPRSAHGFEFDIDVSQCDSNTRGSNLEYDLRKIGLGYIHNFELKKRERWIPMLAFGVGQINVDNGTRDSNSTFLRTGGGSRYFFNDWVAFRFDARLFWWRGDKQVTPRDAFFSFEVALGVSFILGRGE